MSIQTIEKFYVLGISTRTTNANGQAAKDIEALWTKFWGEGIQQKIPNKISEEIYAVYTDYETDYTGYYTAIIGFSVTSLADIPANMMGIAIETTTYEKIVSIGKMPEAIVNTWLEIWGNKALDSRRSYQSDFTIHGDKYNDSDQAEVETFIAIK